MSMPIQELIDRINNGEDSFTQFKSQAIPARELAKECVAFLNAEGGDIIFGVEDRSAQILGLEFEEAEQLSQLIGNCANENVKPPFHPLVRKVTLEGKRLLVMSIPKGTNKPYATSSGDFYIRSSSDKKKIAQDELRRLFAESKRLFADEEPIYGSSIKDLDVSLFLRFLERDNPNIYLDVQNEQLALPQVLHNLGLLKDEVLTLAGNLIFGSYPQRFNKSFYIDCCYFDGNHLSTSGYKSRHTLDGNFPALFRDSLNFLKVSLSTIQTGKDFNSPVKLEIDERILTELMVNALVHRDYFIASSIKVFIFNDRVEIISPGKLTNSLSVEKIKSGISIHRNPILNSICKSLLPYSGYGSGIKRVLHINPEVGFVNDRDTEQFICIIPRPRRQP